MPLGLGIENDIYLGSTLWYSHSSDPSIKEMNRLELINFAQLYPEGLFKTAPKNPNVRGFLLENLTTSL